MSQASSTSESSVYARVGSAISGGNNNGLVIGLLVAVLLIAGLFALRGGKGKH